jgi:hypothetical protein
MAAARSPSFLMTMLMAAFAGGMGWGIRGQYGHESGAMMAGLLVSLVLVLRFCPHASSLSAIRAVALMTLGVSLGGSMTYGQTVGLTHDAELVGNGEALRWGLLGLFLKGGIWISLAATWFAVGINGKRYRPLECTVLVGVMILLWFLGVYLWNQPYEPSERLLPRFYFSDSWVWEPDAELKPRREIWGGLLTALVGLVAYLRFGRQDRLALRLAVWGFLGGGLGFSLGQCWQAYHAWNVEWFANTPSAQPFHQYVNWWNLMETTFGLIFGAVLALGLWLNRHLIEMPTVAEQAALPGPEMTGAGELALVLVHTSAIVVWNFVSYPAYDVFADQAVTMILLPVAGVLAGRYWPYWLTLPIVLIPIAGKTVRELVYYEAELAHLVGWLAYFAVPVAMALLLAWQLGRRQPSQRAAHAAAIILLFSATTFWFLNFAFFRYPWPWVEWTQRTLHGLIYTVCWLGLVAESLVVLTRRSE